MTREENYPLLRQNSTVVFLEREDLNTLSKLGRPVSAAKSAAQLAAERMPMYRSWSDVTVKCIDPKRNAENILEAIKP